MWEHRDEVLIAVDQIPLWVRVSAVQAISVGLHNETIIHLSNGDRVTTDTSVEDVIKLFTKAVKT